MLGDRFVLLLIGQYAVACGLYACQGQWFKALYWLSALGITVAVRGMR